MKEEPQALFKTLEWAVDTIAQSGPDDRKRIALAYMEARKLVCDIPKEDGSVRTRILTCFERSDAYRTVNDIACVGWILTGMQERVEEQDFPEWPEFQIVIDKAVKMLFASGPTVH